ncbi:MAG: diguanylate cyclase [Rhodocyclaceae bacterium]|nr:diguanylate cyclase [Rhodocyclaceae bacterium]MDZ4213485.1 diguanylate cyclase [Rhodocyclaceae bacterium]
MNDITTTGMKMQVVQRYGQLVALLYLGSAVFFVALGVLEWQRVSDNTDVLARERGRVLFGLVEMAREWNAGHGGVYVPVTEATQPNPYLVHPQRDQTTTEGRALTMINPAFMTRQIAELAAQKSGLRFNITSLRPIRPGNAPDPWESETLRRFEDIGLKERIEFFPAFPFGDKAGPAHRYMAPLHVKPPCMACHAKQGYQVGDIRGGISVTMPAEALLAIRDQQRRSSLLIILGGFIVTVALLHLLAARARRHYRDLQAQAARQEDVIAARTAELAERNVALKLEVEERRRNERELRIAGAVFDSAAEAIMVTDAQNLILRVNPAFTVITGYTPKEVVGLNPTLLKSGRHDASYYAVMWDALQSRGHWQGEIWNRHKNGNIYVEWLSISRIEADETTGGHYLAVFNDITQRKEAEEILRHRANFDALTDLPNRSLFYDRLQAAINQAHRYHRIFVLLMIDLDHFKEVNDTFGHPAGDELLVEASRRLISCVRESDTVARLGGDEFAVILSEILHAGEAEQIAQRMVRLMAEPFHLDAGTAHVSASIGLAVYPQHGADSEQLQRNADKVLYQVKESGRNAYRVFSPKRHSQDGQGDLL